MLIKLKKAVFPVAGVGTSLLHVPTPEIFQSLRGLIAGSYGEIQLADSINIYAKQRSVEIVGLNGRRFDCGAVGWFMQASGYEYEQRLFV